MAGDFDVGRRFIHVPVPERIHADPEIHHLGRIRLGGSMDRTGMELVHIHVHREEGSREKNVFASESHRTPDRHPGHFASHELGDKRLIRVETAGRENHAALRVNHKRPLGRHRFNARAAKHIVMQQLNHLGIEHHRNVQFLHFRHHVLHHLGAAGTGLRIHLMAAAKHRLDLHRNLFPAEVAAVSEPLHSACRLLAVHLREFRVTSALRHHHHVLIERVKVIGDAVTLLNPGAGRVDKAARVNRVTHRNRGLLNEKHLRAPVRGFDRRREPGAACADHDHVIGKLLRFRSLRRMSGSRNRGGRGSSGTREARFEKISSGCKSHDSSP